MCRKQRFYIWKVLLLTFILNTFVRQTFSDNRLCVYNFQSVEVLHGQIVSERFHLTGPMLENHSLVWIIPNTGSMKCNSDLQCTSNDSSISTRYRLIKAFENNTNTYKVIIESAQEQDSGRHLIIVYEGRETCTALIFLLTVVRMDSKCSTWLDKEKVKIQMTCQWTQVSNNDHAEFHAGKQVMFEDRASNNTFDDNSNLIHEFSVYVDFNDIIAFEYNCVVFHGRSNANVTCSFLTAQYLRLEQSKSVNETFECCVNSENNPEISWNKAGGEVLTLNHTTSDTVFICVEDNHDSDPSQPMVYEIGILDFTDEGDGNDIIVAKLSTENMQHENSTDEMRCEIISVNITTPHSPSTINGTDEINISSITISTEPVSSSNTSKSPPLDNHDNLSGSIWMSAALVAISAFVFSIGVIFIILCYYNYLRKDKYHVSQDRSTERRLASEQDTSDESRSHEMTTFSSNTLRHSLDTDVHGQVSDQLSTTMDNTTSDCVTMQSNNDDRDEHKIPPVLCEIQDSFPTQSISYSNIPTVNTFDEAGCFGYSCNDKCVGQQHAGNPLLMPPSPENAYSSVDNVKDVTIFTESENQPSKPTTFLGPHQSSYIHDVARPDGDVISDPSFLTNKPKDLSRDVVTENWTQPAADLEAMYAQPDMSRKTKIKGKTSQLISQVSSEGVCGRGPSDPTEDAFQNTPSASYHLYSSVPTDMYGCDNTAGIFESTGEGDLYINSSVHRFE